YFYHKFIGPPLGELIKAGTSKQGQSSASRQHTASTADPRELETRKWLVAARKTARGEEGLVFHKQHRAHILAVIQLQIEGPNAQVFFRCVTKMEPIEVRKATAIGGNDFTIDDGERHGDRSEYLGHPPN